jgi:hypothetical protein
VLSHASEIAAFAARACCAYRARLEIGSIEIDGWGRPMAKMTEEQLADIGREWLRIVALARKEDICVEHDHVRFRDSDLSIKGGAPWASPA